MRARKLALYEGNDMKGEGVRGNWLLWGISITELKQKKENGCDQTKNCVLQ